MNSVRGLWLKPISEKTFVAAMLVSWVCLILFAVPVLKYLAFVPAALISGWAMRQRLEALQKPAWIAVVPMVSYAALTLCWHLVGARVAPDFAGATAVFAFGTGAWAGLWVFEQGRKLQRP